MPNYGIVIIEMKKGEKFILSSHKKHGGIFFKKICPRLLLSNYFLIITNTQDTWWVRNSRDNRTRIDPLTG